MLCFSIYDKKVGEYMTPFFAPNRISAIRSLQAALRDKSNLSMYPHDFTLFELGSYNKDEGLLVSNGQPKFCEEIANLLPKEGVSNV